eukprot:GDKI01035523.1.p1 GENE.GDKI01035523.1~~GDKI01035523.1.p1  ORF type:complete len:552 (+),score=93.71 GDKI01035523.1:69-1658(+)
MSFLPHIYSQGGKSCAFCNCSENGLLAKEDCRSPENPKYHKWEPMCDFCGKGESKVDPRGCPSRAAERSRSRSRSRSRETAAIKYIAKYAADQLSSADIATTLLHPIPPVRLSSSMWAVSNTPTSALDPNIALISPDANFHGDLSLYVCTFMRNDKKGSMEDGLHFRDDLLLGIICEVAGLNSERNRASVSTSHRLRSDVYLYRTGLPPLVHVEEKADAGALSVATRELAAKFCSTLPHYDRQLQFIIGIAIAGDFVSFGKLPLGGGGAWVPLDSFNISVPTQRLKCVQAAVNVGRWCVHAFPLVSCVRHPFGLTNSTDQRDITLLPKGCVVKWYKQLTPQQCTWLRDLYTSIAVGGADGMGRIPFMEFATECCAFSDTSLKVTLKPLGVPADLRLPRDLVELRVALRCILQCLEALHARGWAHLDVRWSNVIYLAPHNWTVIDAEFARPFGSPIPDSLTCKDPQATTADGAADCYLVGCMLKDVLIELIVQADPSRQAMQLQQVLLDHASPRRTRNARDMLSHPFFSA